MVPLLFPLLEEEVRIWIVGARVVGEVNTGVAALEEIGAGVGAFERAAVGWIVVGLLGVGRTEVGSLEKKAAHTLGAPSNQRCRSTNFLAICIIQLDDTTVAQILDNQMYTTTRGGQQWPTSH